MAVAAMVGGGAVERAATAAPPPRPAPVPAAPADDWTLHTALGLELGVGSTITDYNENAGSSATLFYTALRGTYDVSHSFSALLTLRQWWLPTANHATMFGVGARYEPFVFSYSRIFFDAAIGPTSTSFEPGSTWHIRSAVSCARMSLSAPRITSVRAVIRVYGTHMSNGRAAVPVRGMLRTAGSIFHVRRPFSAGFTAHRTNSRNSAGSGARTSTQTPVRGCEKPNRAACKKLRSSSGMVTASRSLDAPRPVPAPTRRCEAAP